MEYKYLLDPTDVTLINLALQDRIRKQETNLQWLEKEISTNGEDERILKFKEYLLKDLDECKTALEKVQIAKGEEA